MPSFSVKELATSDLIDTRCPLPVFHDGKLFLLGCRVDKANILNVDDLQLVNVDVSDPDRLSNITRLFDFKAVTKSTYVIKTLHIRSGTLVIDRYEYDLDAMTVSRTEEATYSLSWISAWEELEESVVIPPYLWVTFDKETSYAKYVDLRDGSEISWDTGFGSYFPRFSSMWVIRKDDIYMLIGKHQAGSNHMMCKLYSKTITDLGFSTGGGSPRPCANPSFFCNETLLIASSGGVDDADNDIAILDADFNLKKTIDLASITGWASNEIMLGGFNIFAKARDGSKYYALLAVADNSGAKYTATRVYLLELDSQLNVTNSTLIKEISKGEWALGNGGLAYCSRPVFVTNRKKIYVFGMSYPNAIYVVELDVSDIYDTYEFNKYMWYLNSRIPTSLTLQVTPL